MSAVTTATWVQRAKVKYQGVKDTGEAKGQVQRCSRTPQEKRQTRREEKREDKNGFRTVNMEGRIRATEREYAYISYAVQPYCLLLLIAVIMLLLNVNFIKSLSWKQEIHCIQLIFNYFIANRASRMNFGFF